MTAVTLAGQVIAGACVSLTLTMNPHELVLPAPSVAEQTTAVLPTGNDDPDGGEQTKVNPPGQLSVAVALKFTTAEH